MTGKYITSWGLPMRLRTWLGKPVSWKGFRGVIAKTKVNSAHLMNQFEGYVENYKFFYKDYSGPDPKTLPAAEAFHQFNKLLCGGFLKDE